jgi:hypothetical protein
MIISLYSCHWISYCVMLVLMQIGQPRPHVLSRLTILLSSVDGTIYRRFYTLPTTTVWLGCPDLGEWLGISEFAHLHTLLQIIITSMMYREHKYIHIH